MDTASTATTPESGGIPPTAPAAEVSEDTGAIEGSVLDPELQAVEGAVVAVGDGAIQTITAQDGRFTLNMVPPGTHNLFAQKLGYEAAGRKVEVFVGQVATAQLTLVPLAVQEPYPVSMRSKGMLACAVGIKPVIGVAACGLEQTQFVTNDKFLIVWELKEPIPEWKSATLETHWKSNQALGQGLNPIWEVNECYNDNDVTFAEGPGRSPKIFQIDEERIEWVLKNVEDGKGCPNNSGATAKKNCNDEKCVLVSRMFNAAETTGQAADVGITWQQNYENFLTAFFYEPGPEGFTAASDT